MEENSQRIERLGQLQETQRRQEATVVPQMLARRVRHGLQLQLMRKNQINRTLRKGLIKARKQLHLNKIQLRKYKLQSEKQKKEIEELRESKNETIVDLQVQVQRLKKDMQLLAIKERILQSEREELVNEITAMTTSLQHQLLEKTVLANEAAELQQQLDTKNQTITSMQNYRHELEHELEMMQHKLDLLAQEMDQMVHEKNLMLHYVVTMQACLYDDVEQWLQQLQEDDRVTETSVHKFKTIREQINLMKPILARDRAVEAVGQEEGEEEEEEEYENYEEEEEEYEDYEEEEEEYDEDEEDGEDDEEEGEEEDGDKGERRECWETTESEEVEEEEKQREVEEDHKVQKEKKWMTFSDLYKLECQKDQSTNTDARHKNVFEDTSESESASSGLSSGSTSSTARNSSDSNGSTSTGSAENSKVKKSTGNKLKSWFKKTFTLKATRKPAASKSDHQDKEKASNPPVWKIILSAICLPLGSHCGCLS